MWWYQQLQLYFYLPAMAATRDRRPNAGAKLSGLLSEETDGSGGDAFANTYFALSEEGEEEDVDYQSESSVDDVEDSDIDADEDDEVISDEEEGKKRGGASRKKRVVTRAYTVSGSLITQ